MSVVNNDAFQTKESIQAMIRDGLNNNTDLKNGLDILTKNPGMLTYQTVNGKPQVVIRSTVGKVFQGFNKPKICQETIEVEKLLKEYYSTENPNVQIIHSNNVNALCPPASGGSKSRRRKTHNKRAFRSKSKTQRRRRARMSRK